MDQRSLQTRLEICYKVYELYSDILNSYVADYYVENHWNKLSTSWKQYFNNIEVNQLSNILNLGKPLDNLMYPLTLLCLRNIITKYTLSRKMVTPISVSPSVIDNKFMNFFWKNVKLKKRHEIDVMSKLCYDLAIKTKCFHIVDIGSGLGHLSRMLSYGYGFSVCTFEAVDALTNLATAMDTNFEETLNKRNIKHKSTFRTVHINKKISTELIKTEFLNLVIQAFKKNIKFGLVGLHPCGDLGTLLLKLYTHCPNIVYINIASCCYMKITLEPLDEAYFPLSQFCKNKHMTLSYLSCEIACHAIENYSEKLKNAEEYQKLKIHSYRAALEDILVTADPNLRHSMICGAKCDKNLTFKKYVEKVCDKLHIIADEKILLYENIVNNTWNKVVSFYSVRLLLAPVVENIVLLDRLLYVLESGSFCKILPVFDCNISPRNQVLSGVKIKK